MGFIKYGIKKLEAMKNGIESMMNDKQGSVGALMISGIIAIVALVVISILGSSLLPGAVTTVTNTTTTGWADGAVSMWTSIPIFIILGFLLIVLGIALYVLKALDN